MPFTSLQYSLFSLLILLSVGRISAWDYSDPNAWKDEFPKCGGKYQTPIALSPDSSDYKEGLELELSYVVQNSINFVVSDTGLKIAFHNSTLPGSATECLTTGSFIAPPYRLEQMHFHWAQEGDAGSEHIINGTPAVLEVHFVHFRSDLNSVAHALTQSKGLLVVGTNFYLDTAEGALGSPLLDDIASILASTNQTSDINIRLEDANLDVVSLLPPSFPDKFYTYQGSLTTPSCDESVTWIMAADASSINTEQLNMFRSLMQADGVTPIAPNYRPLQDLNARTAQRSFSIPSDTDSCDIDSGANVAQWSYDGKNVTIPFYAAAVLASLFLLASLKVCMVYYSYCCGRKQKNAKFFFSPPDPDSIAHDNVYGALHSSHSQPSVNEGSHALPLL